MAMSVRYHSIDGEILYQSGTAGRIDYLPDALGNVMATTKPNQPGVVDNTYRYKPYGDRLAKTGTGIDPKYQWVGTRTYRDTGLAHSSHYMIARHYAEDDGRWTTVDPIWPWEHSYGYAISNPACFADPSGLAPLSCKTLVKTNGKCPNIRFLWRIQWILDGKTLSSGFIVQKIRWNIKGFDCFGNKLNTPPDIVYFEAWQYKKTRIFAGYDDKRGQLAPTDDWGIQSGNALCRFFVYTVTAVACLFPGISIGWQRGGVPQAADLPSVGEKPEPEFWKGRKNCITRKLDFAIICCKDKRCNCDGEDQSNLTAEGCGK